MSVRPMPASDPYVLTLTESSRLKLRATTLLAIGDDEARFEAAVLFHEAARAEARALMMLETPSASTRLASVIERCGCLLDARDVTGTMTAWGEVLEATQDVPRAQVRALLARLEPQFHAFERELAQTSKGLPLEIATDPFGFWQRAASDAKARARSRKAICALLSRFPGDPVYWSVLASLEEMAGDDAAAWHSIGRAQKLSPSDPTFTMLATLLVTTRPRPEAEVYLDDQFARLRRAPHPAACFAFALASLLLAAASPRRRLHWERAREIARQGHALVPALRYQSQVLRLLELASTELLEGRRAGPDLFYRAGLGGMTTSTSSEDALAVLAHERRHVVGRFLAA